MKLRKPTQLLLLLILSFLSAGYTGLYGLREAEIWLTAVNLTAFTVCVYDKNAARLGVWRIPELILLVLTAAAGFAGMILGMLFCRHKTAKSSFITPVAGLSLLQISIYLLIRG